MEPFVQACLVVALNHLSVRDILAEAVSWLGTWTTSVIAWLFFLDRRQDLPLVVRQKTALIAACTWRHSTLCVTDPRGIDLQLVMILKHDRWAETSE